MYWMRKSTIMVVNTVKQMVMLLLAMACTVNTNILTYII